MKSLDELVADKIIDMINYVLSKIIKPDIRVNKVTDLDEQMITRLKQEYNIEGIILDVDETLRKDMKNIPECNKEWIESLKNKLKIIILSNGNDKKIEEYFKSKNIDYIAFAHKPLKKNFLKSCEKMNLNPEKVLVIGDSLYSDIHGGNKNNMKTALVKSVEYER